MKYSVHTPERDLRSDIKIEHLRSLGSLRFEVSFEFVFLVSHVSLKHHTCLQNLTACNFVQLVMIQKTKMLDSGNVSEIFEPPIMIAMFSRNDCH